MRAFTGTLSGYAMPLTTSAKRTRRGTREPQELRTHRTRDRVSVNLHSASDRSKEKKKGGDSNQDASSPKN